VLHSSLHLLAHSVKALDAADGECRFFSPDLNGGFAGVGDLADDCTIGKSNPFFCGKPLLIVFEMRLIR
jgi:hypothetical protein